jgi:hypothetical protein
MTTATPPEAADALRHLLDLLERAVRETGSLTSERVVAVSSELDAWVVCQMSAQRQNLRPVTVP